MIERDDEPFELQAESAADMAAQLAAEKFEGVAWPKTLADLMDVMTATLERRGMQPEAAEETARALAIAQARYIGGRSFYLPTGRALETALLHDAIYRASRRGNTDALARRHGLTHRAIQMIVRRQTLLHRARVQMQLPIS